MTFKRWIWRNSGDIAIYMLVVLLAFIAPYMTWGFIGVIWVLMFIIKLCLKLIAAFLDTDHPWCSLKRMWVFPATFLLMLPWYLYIWYEARAAGNQLLGRVEQYHQAHGVYPPDKQSLGLSQERISSISSFVPYYSYDAAKQKPMVIYRDRLNTYSIYSYDFEQKIWRHSNH